VSRWGSFCSRLPGEKKIYLSGLTVVTAKYISVFAWFSYFENGLHTFAGKDNIVAHFPRAHVSCEENFPAQPSE